MSDKRAWAMLTMGAIIVVLLTANLLVAVREPVVPSTVPQQVDREWESRIRYCNDQVGGGALSYGRVQDCLHRGGEWATP